MRRWLSVSIVLAALAVTGVMAASGAYGARWGDVSWRVKGGIAPRLATAMRIANRGKPRKCQRPASHWWAVQDSNL